MNTDCDTSMNQDKNIRSEVVLIWEELDKARNTLYDVKKLVNEIQKENRIKGLTLNFFSLAFLIHYFRSMGF